MFGHSFGRPEGGAFTKDGYIKILQKFVKQRTNGKHLVLKMHVLKDILKYKKQIKHVRGILRFYGVLE
jgi:hypothetical protein